MKLTTISTAFFLSPLALVHGFTITLPVFQGWPWEPSLSSKAYQQEVKLNKILAHSHKLVEFSKLSNGTRSFGSSGHNATTAYIKRLLDQTGYYKTELQTFPHLSWTGSSQFSIDGKDYATSTFTYGAPADVTAPLVLVNNVGCELSDFPEAVKGKIAFIKRGTCEFGLKVAYAGASGAAGAIIFNNADGTISGTLSGPSRPEGPYVGVGGISGEDGEVIRVLIAAGQEVIGTLKAAAESKTLWSNNVIATTKRGDQNNIVFSGAHSDSVPAGPGINDDGSGTVALIELALRLAGSGYKLKNAVRFGWWTAEEVGLVGSEYYTTHLTLAENQKIALYLNYDMIASPNGGYFIHDGNGDTFGITGPAGSEHIEQTFVKYFTSLGIQNGTAAFNGRSDYGPFLDAGIPAGGVASGAEGIKTDQEAAWWGGKAGIAYDPCYHQACDGIDNLNTTTLLVNTKAAAHLIATYSNSLAGIPRSRNQTVLRRSTRASTSAIHDGISCAHDHEVAI